MVTGYGLTLRDKRYKSPHDEHLAELQTSAAYDSEQTRTHQWRLFRGIIEHAFQQVPFYRNLASEQGLSPNDFRDFSDLAKLPIIEKETIRQDPRLFCADDVIAHGDVFILHTSGTSGKALTLYADKVSRRKHYAFWTRLRQRHGVMPGMRRATMFGRIICSSDQKKPPFWRYDAVGKNLLMSSYHLSAEHLPSYATQLERYKPDEVIGYASSVFLLAKYLQGRSDLKIRPKVVFTTADTLIPHYRPIIESAFGCPVIDQYGCAEMAVFAAQVPGGEYIVDPEHSVLEVVDAGNRPVAAGQTGEAICTGLVNRAMPLIRYRLGDLITTSSSLEDADGLVPMFKEIVGRVDDILYSPDGRPLARFSPIWKVVDGIYETQVVQNTLDQLDINIVIDDSFRNDPDSEKKLVDEIQKRTGTEMTIRINYVDEIPKNRNGKFKTVISRVKP